MTKHFLQIHQITLPSLKNYGQSWSLGSVGALCLPLPMVALANAGSAAYPATSAPMIKMCSCNLKGAGS